MCHPGLVPTKALVLLLAGSPEPFERGLAGASKPSQNGLSGFSPLSPFSSLFCSTKASLGAWERIRAARRSAFWSIRSTLRSFNGEGAKVKSLVDAGLMRSAGARSVQFSTFTRRCSPGFSWSSVSRSFFRGRGFLFRFRRALSAVIKIFFRATLVEGVRGGALKVEKFSALETICLDKISFWSWLLPGSSSANSIDSGF